MKSVNLMQDYDEVTASDVLDMLFSLEEVFLSLQFNCSL